MDDLLYIPPWLRREPSTGKVTAPRKRKLRIPDYKAPKPPTQKQTKALTRLGWERWQIIKLSRKSADFMIEHRFGPEARHDTTKKVKE